jgi:hypothetical protein
MDYGFLFRALRQEEVDAGCVLIPKTTSSFLAGLRFPVVFPVVFGETVDHAIRDHQWSGKYETSGISTTSHLHRARHYAQKVGVIVKIPTTPLSQYGVKTYAVKEHVSQALIAVPEDDEVILVCEKGYAFPKEIICDVIRGQEP